MYGSFGRVCNPCSTSYGHLGAYGEAPKIDPEKAKKTADDIMGWIKDIGPTVADIFRKPGNKSTDKAPAPSTTTTHTYPGRGGYRPPARPPEASGWGGIQPWHALLALAVVGGGIALSRRR